MKSNEEFTKYWTKIHSLGFLRYIVKDLLYYFLIVLVGYLLLLPLSLLIRYLFFHEGVVVAWRKVLNILAERRFSLTVSILVIACVVEFLNTLRWFLNEKKYKGIIHSKEE